MPERRFADLCDLLADASGSAEKATYPRRRCGQERPFRFAGNSFIPDGVATAHVPFLNSNRNPSKSQCFRTVESGADVGRILYIHVQSAVFPPDRSARGLNVGRLVVCCGSGSGTSDKRYNAKYKVFKTFLILNVVNFISTSGFPVTNGRIRGRVLHPSPLPETPTGHLEPVGSVSVTSAAVCRGPSVWRLIIYSRKRFCTRRRLGFFRFSSASSNSNSISPPDY